MRHFLLAFLLISSSHAAHFSWRRCPNAGNSALSISAMGMSPDPIQLDDHTSVTFRSHLTRNVSYPLTLAMTVKKVTLFNWEMRIPCMSVGAGLPVGSCTYDLCSTMQHLESLHGCPRAFTDNNLPCSCPFVGGSAYNVADDKPISLYLDTSGLPSIMSLFLTGKYRITVDVWDNDNNKVTCVEMKVRLAR